mmetsp:Transcript_14902/g.37065  ORF Transcript_14902/g.37065 Transcript_14902/m.37065 type:complete len:306 (+) Transcript_14902:191-1108(+)
MHVFSLTVQVGEGFPSRRWAGKPARALRPDRERSLRELFREGSPRGEHASRPPGLRAPGGAVAAGQLGPSWASGGSTARGGGGAEELRGEHLESLARRVAPSEGRPRRAAFGGTIGSSGRRARTTAGRLLHVSEACQQRVARRTWVLQDGVVLEQGARRELQRPRAARRVEHLPQRGRRAARQIHRAAAWQLEGARRLSSVRQHGRARGAAGARGCSSRAYQRIEGGRGGEERRRLQAQSGGVGEARLCGLVAASAARRARIARHRGGTSGSLHGAVRRPACQAPVCQRRHIRACVLSVPGRRRV